MKKKISLRTQESQKSNLDGNPCENHYTLNPDFDTILKVWSLISQNMFIRSFFKSRFSHKSVN